jgi:predicted N-acyltransferase
MRIHVASSFDDLSPDDWRRLAKNRSAFQQEAWYRSGAETAGRLRLFLAEESGRVILALPLYRLDRPGHYYSSPSEILTGAGEEEMLRDRRINAEPLLGARTAPWYPAMSSMSPYGYRGGILSDPGVGSQQLQQFLKLVLSYCADDRIRVVSFHYIVEHEDAPLMGALIGQGGSPAVLGASCHLPVPWPSTDEYFSWLGSSRRSIRADYRRADLAPDVTWKVTRPAEISSGDAAQLALLFGEALRRHGESNPPAGLLRNCAYGAAGESALFLACDQSGIRSALTALRHGDTLYPKFYGTNASRGHYFPLGYWHTLRYALAHGLRIIDFGGGATRAKLWRGASLYWDLGVLFFLDQELGRAADPVTRIMSTANHSYFTQLAGRWARDHAAPPLPPGFSHLSSRP